MPDVIDTSAPDAPQEATPAAPPSPALLMGPDGDVYRFADPTRALATGDYRALTPEEAIAHRVEKEEEAKGAIGSLEAAGKSALNQLLLGIPGAISEHGETPEQRAEREAREAYHQPARVLGGGAGILGSLLAGGPLFKAVGAAGEAVAHGILPAEEIASAGLASRLAATTANYATQGAIMATPQAVVQAAFGDPQQAAETLLWGVGLGGALGGAGELMAAGGRRAVEGIEGLLGREGTQEAIDQFAIDRGAKAIGAERSQLNKLSKEQIAQKVGFAFDEGLIKPGMSRADIGAAIDAAHERWGGQIGDALNNLDGLVTKGTVEQDLTAHAIKPGELGDAIWSKLNSPELQMPMNADQARALEMVRESANKIPTRMVNGREVVAFEDAQKFVSNLRKKWVNSIGRDVNEGGIKGMDVVTPLDQMKSAAYQVARDAVHKAGDRVALAANEPELVGQLAAAKRAYANVAELDKWASTVERQSAGNRMIGLTDFFHMGAGSMVGAGIGGAFGSIAGPAGIAAGAFTGKVAGGLLSLVAKHWMEDKGLVYLSALARRAAKEGPEVFSAVMASEGGKRLAATMSGVQDTIRKLASVGIAEVGARKQEHMKALLGSTVGLTPDQSYSKLSNRLTQLATNPAAMAHVTAQLSSPYMTSAPQVADAYQQKLSQAIGYLYSALPKSPAPPAPFTPDYWAPSPADKMSFHDKAEIVANPMSAMRHLETGTLSDAHMDALRNVYPVVLEMMQRQVLDFSANHPGVKLPVAERQSVAKLLGTSLSSLDTPDARRALQASFVPPSQGGAQPPAKPRGKSLDKSPQMRSTTFTNTMGPNELGT